MDALIKAGVAMALGLTLLIPTFNAVNNSYIEVSEVPPWLPEPKDLPENLRPPEKLPDPPPDWRPPPGWKPPEGWEDWEPPEDWKERFKDMDNADQCPPPVKRTHGPWSFAIDDTGSWSSSFDLPAYTLGFAVNFTLANWRADGAAAALEGPDDLSRSWSSSQSVRDGPEILSQNANNEAGNFTYDPRKQGDQLPPAGTYVFTAEWGTYQINREQGRWDVTIEYLVACGGAFS